MKTFFSVLVVLAIASTANAYTYDGVIDPKDFKTWKETVLYITKDPMGTNCYLFEKGGLKALVFTVVLSSGLEIIVQYTYSINFKQYVFQYNPVEKHYTQVHPKEVIVCGKKKEGKKV